MAEILIVEDAPLQQALIKQFVRPNHTVVGCVETATNSLRFAIKHDPDVAIMDINLKEGDGITATKRIKSSACTTKIIISTARVGDDVQKQIRTIPADAYLTKPYSEQELLDAIEQAIQ